MCHAREGSARDGCRRTQARTSEPTQARRTKRQWHKRDKEILGGTAPKQKLRVRIQSGGEGRKGPACADLPRAAFPDVQSGAGVEHDLSGD